MEKIHFEQIRTEFYEMDRNYFSKYSILNEMVDQSISRVEYGKGGATLPRGYYCPSLVNDIIIGGRSRGRLVVNARKNTFYNYIFCFDKDNRLIKVDKYSDKNDALPRYQEYIFYEENNIFSITFKIGSDGKAYGLSSMIKEKYSNNGRLASCYFINSEDIEIESYEYHIDGKIKDVTWEAFLCNRFYQKMICSFSHDTDGYLKDYTVHHKQYDFDGKVSDDEVRYPVLIRRKI